MQGFVLVERYEQADLVVERGKKILEAEQAIGHLEGIIKLSLELRRCVTGLQQVWDPVEQGLRMNLVRECEGGVGREQFKNREVVRLGADERPEFASGLGLVMMDDDLVAEHAGLVLEAAHAHAVNVSETALVEERITGLGGAIDHFLFHWPGCEALHGLGGGVCVLLHSSDDFLGTVIEKHIAALVELGRDSGKAVGHGGFTAAAAGVSARGGVAAAGKGDRQPGRECR